MTPPNDQPGEGGAAEAGAAIDIMVAQVGVWKAQRGAKRCAPRVNEAAMNRIACSPDGRRRRLAIVAQRTIFGDPPASNSANWVRPARDEPTNVFVVFHAD